MRVSTALYGLLTCWFGVYFCWTVSFVENDRPPSFHGALDAGESAAFSGSFLASSFFYSQTESTPAPAPVTQTVGLLVMKE